MVLETRDEIGHLARYFNDFMDKLALTQSLEQEILDISQKAHQKIGRDLHDDLGPHLIGVDFLTCVLEQKLWARNADKAEDASKNRELLADAIHKMRRMARELCTVELGQQGLEASLNELTGYIEDVFGVSCRFICDDTVRIADQSVATHIYYIVHEALHNAVRHSGAKNIRVYLLFHDSHLRLNIEDDGCGIPQHVRSDGMGLNIMKRVLPASVLNFTPPDEVI